MNLPQNEAIAQLEKDMQRVNDEVERLQMRMDECEKDMQQLKVTLYARFGNNISTCARDSKLTLRSGTLNQHHT